MSEELKPCPFCEDKDTLGCCICDDAYFVDHIIDTYKEEWNTRPIEDKLRAGIECLDAALSRTQQWLGRSQTALKKAEAENERLKKHFDNCSAEKIVTIKAKLDKAKGLLTMVRRRHDKHLHTCGCGEEIDVCLKELGDE